MGRLALASLLLAAGCCRAGGVQSAPPATAVETMAGQPLRALAFGPTAFGKTASQSFQVVSQSTVDAHVSVVISGPDAELFTASPAAPTTIPVGGARPFTVTFAPVLPGVIPDGDVQDSATITVTSDDPNHPTTLVLLTGRAAAQRLDLCWAPDAGAQDCASQAAVTVQFGTAPYGGLTPPQEVDIVNRSDVPLTVMGLALDGAALDAGFMMKEHVTTPFPLSAAAGESEVLHLLLDPRGSGPLAGSFLVTSDDPRLAGKPMSLALAGAGGQPGQPIACLGIDQITYADGRQVAVDPTQSLSAQPGVVPPGPLDTARFTPLTKPGCSYDPQDGTNLHYQYALALPAGSKAALVADLPHPPDQTLAFDVAGLYTVTMSFTDSAGLSARAQVTVDARPHDDISFELTWTSPVAVDLDLHFVRVESAGGDPRTLVGNPQEDCDYCNCLKAADYSNGSPCSSPAFTYPTFVDWGAPDDAGVRDRDDPILAAQYDEDPEGNAPLRTQPIDIANLSYPEQGADYDLLVHYFGNPGGSGGDCNVNSDCDADGGWLVCQAAGSSSSCLPAATARLRTFVEGEEVDAGGPVVSTLAEPCALWWAGTLHWSASAEPLPDGGRSPPRFTFTPHTDADGGWLTSAGSLGPSGCVIGP